MKVRRINTDWRVVKPFWIVLTMKQYLPLRDFEDITSALNFDTTDLHIVGGCDLYTTKAAGRDKKLYKDIENSLQTQFASAVKVSERLSPPQAESLAASLNLSRASP